ncbi:twin-arginine translocation signal domain-containing protein [Chloroflexota bacterium]
MKNKSSKASFSRRDFLKAVGTGSVALSATGGLSYDI